MKLQISISALPKTYTTHVDGSVLIYIDKAKDLTKLHKTNSYAKLDLTYVWDKGTEEEQAIPTLTMIKVLKKRLGKGDGALLVSEVLKYQRSKKIPYLIFDDYSNGFWQHMKKKLPDNVLLFKLGPIQLGYLGYDFSNIPIKPRTPRVRK